MVRARAAVQREAQTLARELVASLQFYQTQPGSLPISEILVTGGTSQLPGLVEELERLTRARVRAADPLVRRRRRQRRRRQRRPGIAGRRDRAGGGALMQAVNLLPEYARPGRRWTTRRQRALVPAHPADRGIAAIGLALIFGLFYFHERSFVSDKKSELATAQARLVAQSATSRADQAGAGGESGEARRSCAPSPHASPLGRGAR